MQVDGTSLSTQLKECRATARRMGLSVVEEFPDAGVSGAKESRPQLDRMMSMVRDGLIDVILVAKLDRLGRSLLHLLSLLAECDELGVQVVSISEGFDTNTSVGRLQLSILGSVAEFERARTRDRIQSGLYARAEDGGFVSSRPPFGYRVVPDPRGRGVVLDIDPEQCETVRRAFELLVVRRVGTTRTVQMLNEEGHLARKGLWTRGGLLAWARSKGPDIVGGTWSYAGIEVPIPPILTADEVAQMRAWNLASSTTPVLRGPYLLSGLLIAPCGSPYLGRTVESKTGHQQAPVYMCANKSRTTRASKDWCGCSNVRIDQVDEIVWNEVLRVLTDPVTLAGMRSTQTQTGDTVARITAMSAKLEMLRDKLAHEYQGAIDAGFDMATAHKMIRGRQDEIEAVKAELGRLGKSSAAADGLPASTDLLAQAVAGRVGGMEIDERRSILEMLDLQATISSFPECAACGGSGREPGTASKEARFGRPCGICLGMRRFPEIDVELTVPEELFTAGESTVADVG